MARPTVLLEMYGMNHCPLVDGLKAPPLDPKLCPPVASLQGSRLFSPDGTVGLAGRHQARDPLP